MIVKSSDADATKSPSGDHAAARTGSVCPIREQTGELKGDMDRGSGRLVRNVPGLNFDPGLERSKSEAHLFTNLFTIAGEPWGV